MPFPLIPLLVAGGSALATGLGSYFANRGKQQQGAGAGFSQLSNLSPEQQQLFKSQVPRLQQQLADTSNFDFGKIRQNALQGLRSQTFPSIAERFAAMPGHERSSAYQGALSSASMGLESQLAAQEQDYNLKRQQLLQQQLGTLLNPGFQQSTYQQQAPGFASQFAGELGSKVASSAAEQYAPQLGKSISNVLGGAFDFSEQGQKGYYGPYKAAEQPGYGLLGQSALYGAGGVASGLLLAQLASQLSGGR